MNPWRRNVVGTATLIVALMTASGCTAAPVAQGPDSSAPISSAPASPASPTPSPDDEPQTGAAEAFFAWVEASRIPDVDASCAALAPDLVARMIAELNASGGTTVDTCEQMIAAAAELYRAVGDTGTVDIAVQQETATDAALFVTYDASGDCGTVVMKRMGTDWIITDESHECAR